MIPPTGRLRLETTALLLWLGLASWLTGCGEGAEEEPLHEGQIVAAVAAAFAQCATLCGPGKEGCGDAGQFGTYSENRSAWGACSDSRDTRTSGRCKDGTRFLLAHNGFSEQIRYFSEDGSLQGRSYRYDVISPPCFGITFWPAPTACDSPIVEEVICGDGNVAPDSDEEALRYLVTTFGKHLCDRGAPWSICESTR